MPRSKKKENNINPKKDKKLTKTGKERKLTRRREIGERIPLFLINK